MQNKERNKVKVVQFGEGNFLRGFADYLIELANKNNDFNGDVVVVKPISYGDTSSFIKQNCDYTVLLRGLVNGEKYVETCKVTCLNDIIDCTSEYDKFVQLAEVESIRFIISNTTEAGIRISENDTFENHPSESFPAKLTQFLFERATYFNYDKSKGVILLPVELIDNNGDELRCCVLQCIEKWKLNEEFKQWIEESCVFCNTLVDRIVTGYPRNEIEKIENELGYEDELLVAAEPFALWVIESDVDISEEFPIDRAIVDKSVMNVLFTKNHKPYKQRKVRILNGAHTTFSLASYLKGNNTVLESMNDKIMYNYMKKTIQEEIIPTLDLEKSELLEFTEAVEERFKNPFIEHSLLSISLNSVSKWKARCYPSAIEYVVRRNDVPCKLLFSLASLLIFYKGEYNEQGNFVGKRNKDIYEIKDEYYILNFFSEHADSTTKQLVEDYFEMEELFGNNKLRQPCIDKVIEFVDRIGEIGIDKTCESYGLC